MVFGLFSVKVFGALTTVIFPYVPSVKKILNSFFRTTFTASLSLTTVTEFPGIRQGLAAVGLFRLPATVRCSLPAPAESLEC